jgi:holo-[acyl-carrier protein] synthase
MKSGQPTMALTGGAAARLAALTPEGMRSVIHLSLTDDHPYAQAFVVIEALPL